MKKLLYIIVLFVSLFLTTSCGRKYTISYYVNGELFAVEEYKAKSDIKLISDVQEVGYKFNYWILDNGTKFTETKMPKQNINLYGSFTPNTWKVMFYDDDKLLHSYDNTYGSSISLFDAPLKENMEFIDWRYDDGTKFNGEKMPDNNVKLYANYKSESETEDVINIVINLTDGRQIFLELYRNIAPITVDNFMKLVDYNFYSGTIFHRVIKDFMIQAGGFTLDGYNILSKGDVAPIKGEFAANGVQNNIKHEAGVISMARSTQMDSATSQFFICSADSPHLDGQYAAFGRVVDEASLQVVIDISNVYTIYVSNLFANFPYNPITIASIERV